LTISPLPLPTVEIGVVARNSPLQKSFQEEHGTVVAAQANHIHLFHSYSIVQGTLEGLQIANSCGFERKKKGHII